MSVALCAFSQHDISRPPKPQRFLLETDNANWPLIPHSASPPQWRIARPSNRPSSSTKAISAARRVRRTAMPCRIRRYTFATHATLRFASDAGPRSCRTGKRLRRRRPSFTRSRTRGLPRRCRALCHRRMTRTHTRGSVPRMSTRPGLVCLALLVDRDSDSRDRNQSTRRTQRAPGFPRHG